MKKAINFDTRECDLRISNEEKLYLKMCKSFNERVNHQTPENLGALEFNRLLFIEKLRIR